MPKCDQCTHRAVHGVTDSIEIPSFDPNGWRQFKESEPRLGCAKHPPSVAVTRYLDGRVVTHSQCVPEHTNERLSGNLLTGLDHAAAELNVLKQRFEALPPLPKRFQ